MLGWTGFQIWTACWQLAMFVTPLVLTVAILWLKSQFVTKIEASAEKNRVDARIDNVKTTFESDVSRLSDYRHDHETRIKSVEEYVNRPSSQHKLAGAMALLQGEVHNWGKEVQGLVRQFEQSADNQRRQFDTLNSYLHTLIEKRLT